MYSKVNRQLFYLLYKYYLKTYSRKTHTPFQCHSLTKTTRAPARRAHSFQLSEILWILAILLWEMQDFPCSPHPRQVSSAGYLRETRVTLFNSPKLCHASTASALSKWIRPAYVVLAINSPKSLLKRLPRLELRLKKVSAMVNVAFQFCQADQTCSSIMKFEKII